MRCSADRLAAYFAGVSELSLVVSDECAAVVTSVDGFDKLEGDEQDAAIDRAFEVPCRITEDNYGPDMWGRTVVRVSAFAVCSAFALRFCGCFRCAFLCDQSNDESDIPLLFFCIVSPIATRRTQRIIDMYVFVSLLTTRMLSWHQTLPASS